MSITGEACEAACEAAKKSQKCTVKLRHEACTKPMCTSQCTSHDVVSITVVKLVKQLVKQQRSHGSVQESSDMRPTQDIPITVSETTRGPRAGHTVVAPVRVPFASWSFSLFSFPSPSTRSSISVCNV